MKLISYNVSVLIFDQFLNFFLLNEKNSDENISCKKKVFNEIRCSNSINFFDIMQDFLL